MNDAQTTPVLTDLTELEQRIVDAGRRGEATVPAVTMAVTDLAVTDDSGLRVRADLIRELLLGRRGEVDPRGIRIQGVRVVGRLDLDYLSAVAGLTLSRCALPDGITCLHAQLRFVYLNSSLITGIRADGLRTTDDLHLTDSIITGATERGAVRLVSAHIGGQLNLDRAEITNTTGPALTASRMRAGDCLAMEDATIIGASERGAVRLPGARIGGFADLRVKQLSNSSGPLLVELSDTEIAGALWFPASLLCPEGRSGMNRHDCPHSNRQIRAEQLVFRSLRQVSWQAWLHLLVHHTPNYTAQPFQHLAAVERAAGHDNNARHILITQQEHLRHRARNQLGGPFGYVRHWLWGGLGRYGYRAHRLVTALALTLILASVLGYTAGHITTHPNHHAAERIPTVTSQPNTDTQQALGTPCSTIELIGLGIDRGLPLGATGVRGRCDLDTTTTWGQRITAALWIVQAVIWALATLTIAAYTGLVRKPT